MLKQQRAGGKQKAVIVDLDGVLADCSSALEAMEEGAWEWFHDQCQYFPLLQNGMPPLLRLLDTGGVAILIVTCRPDRYEKATVAWLEHFALPFTEVLLRPQGVMHDEWKTRAAKVLKKEYMVDLAFDDNPAEVARYAEAGIPALLIPSGAWDNDKPWRNWSQENTYGN